jgi:proline iminopeptidase
MSHLAFALLLVLGCSASPPTPAGTAPTAASSSRPAQERFVRSGDVELFVRSVGGGPGASTLVALHGGPGYSHGYLEALEALASPRIRVVTFDQRGCGRSKTPAKAELAMADQVADVDAVRVALDERQVVVLGHSWGGFLAQSYAIEHPDRVRALVLVDPMPNRWGDLEPVIRRIRARRGELVAAGLVPGVAPPPQGDDCRGEMNAELPVDFADPRHPAARSLPTTSCSERTQHTTFDALGRFDLGPRLAALAMPVLLVHGEADPIAVLAPALKRQLAAARVQEALLPSCGHYPFLECPGAFFPRVRAFLDETG